jgi:Domain of unknown function (DUF1736)
MYLHFRYFYQLLWPDSLCAEYAFDCIPKVSSVRDPRFLLVVSFYSFIVSSFFYFLYRVLVPSSLEVRMVLDYGGEEKDVVEGQGKGKYGGKKKERSCAVWKVLPEHYLLSLVWMIVPFIPASGKISFAHTCLVLSSRSSLLYLYLALYLFLHFCLHPPHSLFFF